MRSLYRIGSLALLVALGAVPLACNDEAATDADGGAGGGGAAATGGSSASGGAGGEGGGSGAPTAWLGDEPHLELAGHVDVKAIDLSVSGGEAADLGTLYCERNYIVPDLEDTAAWAADGYLEKIEFKLNFFYEDALAEFQLEVVAEDLPSLEGESLTIGEDAEVAVGLKTDVDGPAEAEFEDEATSGSVVIGVVSGELAADGLTIPDDTGAFGAFLDVTLASGKTVRGSFTANCAENDLEVPE